jgi:hypothetical protein
MENLQKSYWERLAKIYKEKWLSKKCRWFGLEAMFTIILGKDWDKKK